MSGTTISYTPITAIYHLPLSSDVPWYSLFLPSLPLSSLPNLFSTLLRFPPPPLVPMARYGTMDSPQKQVEDIKGQQDPVTVAVPVV